MDTEIFKNSFFFLSYGVGICILLSQKLVILDLSEMNSKILKCLRKGKHDFRQAMLSSDSSYLCKSPF